ARTLQELLEPLGLRFKKIRTRSYAISPIKADTDEKPQSNAVPFVGAGPLEASTEENANPVSAAMVLFKVSGQVTDELAAPLPGVSVLLKTTTNGTITDNQGRYTLNLPTDGEGTLVFSSVGYLNQEVPVNNKTTLNVRLVADVKSLGEVIVVGYGTQKKRDITGSIASISAAEVKAVPVLNAAQALQGRAAGVQVSQTDASPGGNVRVRIRGGNSIQAGSDPLYVIDGFAGAGDLNSINPGDIESIEILKDASATAIYGARGANGVVLITTKRGKAGQSNVDFETYYGWQQVGKKLDLLNGQQYATLVNEAITNDNLYAAANNQKPPFFTADQIAGFGAGTDWQDQIYQTAPMQNYQLTLSGGEAKTRYALSGNYFNQQGVVKNSGFGRGSLRLNLDREINTKFSVGTSLVISRSVRNAISANTSGSISDPSVTQSALNISPTQPVYDANGNYNRNLPGLQPVENPLALAIEPISKSQSDRVLANGFVNYAILKNLTLRVSGGVDVINSKFPSYVPVTIQSAQGGGGIARLGHSEHYSWISENTLTYVRDFGRGSSLNVLAGFTQQSTRSESMNVEVRGFATDDLLYNSLQTGSDFRQPTSGADAWSLKSYIGRINYALRDKYLFTVTGRADGASRFAKNNKWGFFPSGAVAWRLSEEAFLKGIKAISELKIRVSYGLTGNQEIGSYSSIAALGTAPYVFGTTLATGLFPTRVANPDLRWEQSGQLDVGLDVGLWNDRITVTLDYYDRKTTNLLLGRPLPQITGYSALVQNIGSIDNRGVELSINSRNLTGSRSTGSRSTGSLKWTTSLNLSTNRNRVLDLGTNVQGVSNVIFSGGGSSHLALPNVGIVQVGQPLGSFYGLVTDGIFQSLEEVKAGFQPNAKPGDQRYKDLNGDKKVDNSDRTIIGSAQPKFFYGLTNTFNYRGFDLNVFVQGVSGASVFNLNRVELESLNGTVNNTTAVLNRWTPTNPSNTIPRATSSVSIQASDRYVEDASYLRLKNIALGYSLPTGLLQSVRLRSARFYVSAQNFLTLTRYSGYDPEVNSRAGSNTNLGADYGSYPYAKTITVGLNLGL
ncbi:MAG: TonB-dependent receptor, partial [Cytophagaceae bacterium]|nr:TonB-dependent receptor [Cytophagaceae bacterium]